jgi:glycerophosphoryl diester phosphodiesterase
MSCPVTPVAHKGLTTVAPGNTMEAFQAAVDLGVPFECDLRTTRDGAIALMHNAGLAATTNGTGNVQDRPESYIRGLAVDGGGKVPFLAPTLRLIRDNPGARIVLDLQDVPAAQQDRVAELIAEYGIEDRVSAHSFSRVLLRAFKRRTPAARAFTIDTVGDPASLADMDGLDGANIPAIKLTDEWCAAMAAAGKLWNVRTTSAAADWRRGVEVGANWCMTDDVPGYLAAICEPDA